MLAEAANDGPASHLPAQQHAEGSALKRTVELAAVQPASLGMPAVPDVMQAAEIPVSFYVCNRARPALFSIVCKIWAQLSLLLQKMVVASP